MNRREKHAQRRRIVDAVQWAIEQKYGSGRDTSGNMPYDVAIAVLGSLDGAGFRIQLKWKAKPRNHCPDCGALGEIRGHMECQYPSNN